MDGNTGRSEGATAEKAVPFPCAVLDPNRSFVELRVREPQQGLVAFRHLQKSLKSDASPSNRIFGQQALVRTEESHDGTGDFIRRCQSV
jgi:hypothetical protein